MNLSPLISYLLWIFFMYNLIFSSLFLSSIICNFSSCHFNFWLIFLRLLQFVFHFCLFTSFCILFILLFPGIIHAVFELYGAELAGRLLTAFGRLFTYFLQDAGHTCGIADLTLTKSAEAERRKLLEKVKTDAEWGLDAFLSNTSVTDGKWLWLWLWQSVVLFYVVVVIGL